MFRKSIKILGVNIDNISFNDALSRVEGLIESGDAYYIVTPNPEIVLRAYYDHRLRTILNNASIALCDGIGIFLAGMLSNQRFTQRITGVDFMDALCERAEKKRWRIALVGASKNVRDDLCIRYQQIYPTASFQSITDEATNERIDADIIFVALGAPKQEEWMAGWQEEPNNRGITVGVGGAFDILAGSLPRAPQNMRSLGLEWLWRLFLQPWRIKRIVNAVVVFPIVFIINELSRFRL